MVSSLLLLALLANAPEAPAAPVPPSAPTAAATRSATSTAAATPAATPSATPTPTPTATPKRAGAQPSDSRPPPLSNHGAPKEPLLNLATPVRAPLPEPMPLPPALSDSALRDELRASSRRRQEQLAALARETARIEKLTAEIAGARTALREETARLDERVKKIAAEKPAAHGAVGAPGRSEKEAAALAKTLKGMKPDQAAALVARLDRPLAIDLLRRMRPGDLAVVLEKLKPELAAEL
ncbi:MAG TPA: hypothetical protein VF341_00785, partial [Anaeromyxobacteraceae bacterium]